jgi:hypothetical protein
MRLARRIVAADPRGRVLIHHDAGAPALPPSADERIAFVRDRVRVSWGDFSVVAAMLRCVRDAAAIPFDWMVLLSGQDYPSAPLHGLDAQLAASGVDGFVEHAPFAQRFADDNATRYLFAYRRLPDALLPAARRAWRLNRMQPFARIVATRAGAFAGVRSPAPFGPHFAGYRGSFWWTLSRACVDEVRRFAAERPADMRAFERKLIPDEAFVPSILANAGRFTLAARELRYIVWPPGDGGSPAVLRSADFAAIVGAGVPFARKFDAAVDAAILDRLDAVVAGA